MDKIRIVFFGTPQFAVTILDELKMAGIMPTLVVTAPDKPKGRGLVMTAPPVKIWAEKNIISVIQPKTLKKSGIESNRLFTEKWDVFIVAAYGKIILENILNIPKYKTLNVHPSLLPKFRGPSPIESAILNDERDTGVSIMRLDAEIDHGPIITQERVTLENWPLPASELENKFAHIGGAMLAKILPNWIAGKIKEKEQDHESATYCQKISKSDGLIDLSADPYKNYLKICAYTPWPGSYFFQEVSRNGPNSSQPEKNNKIRVIIKKASFKDGHLTIEKVIPEGKSEMSYFDFLRGMNLRGEKGVK